MFAMLRFSALAASSMSPPQRSRHTSLVQLRAALALGRLGLAMAARFCTVARGEIALSHRAIETARCSEPGSGRSVDAQALQER